MAGGTGIRITGIEFVLKNLSGFLSGLNQGNKAVGNLGNISEAARRKIEALGVSSRIAARNEQTATNNLETQKKRLQQADERLAKAQQHVIDLQNSGKATAAQLAAADQRVADRREEVTEATNRVADAERRYENAQERSEQSARKVTYAEQDAAAGAQGLVNQIGSLVGVSTSLTGTLGKVAIAAGVVGVAFGAVVVIVKTVVAGFTALANAMIWVVNSAVKVATTIGGAVVNAFKGLYNILEAITRPLRNFIGHVLEITTGILFADAIRKMGEALQQLGSDVMGAAADFQDLEIRLESLVARDYAEAMGTSMTDALDATSSAAEGLFEWMRTLSINTPYQMQDIADIYTLGSAMGMTEEKVKELTTATLNFSAAFGLGNDAVWRIVYSMGQMLQTGRLSGQEFRDLGRNFIPVYRILNQMAAEAGMTTDKFRQMAVEGGVPVEEFIQRFIDLVEKDYPNAAKRMIRTTHGAISEMQDLIKSFIGYDIFKPVLDLISGKVSDTLYGIMNDPRFGQSTKMIGQALVQAFNIVSPALDKLVNGIKTLLQSLGLLPKAEKDVAAEAQGIYGWAHVIIVDILTLAELFSRWVDSIVSSMSTIDNSVKPSFMNLIDSALNWGKNLISSFVEGIAWGIDRLSEVINTITGILTYWLSPGSPPKVAPNIDQWGADTMMEYLKGFTQVDYDVFDSITKLMTSFFESVKSTFAEEEFIPMILGRMQAVASAVSSMGKVGAGSAMQNLMTAVGIADVGFEEYIEAMFSAASAEKELQAASNALAAAQSNLNIVTTKYDSILTGLQSQLTEVTSGYDEEVRLGQINTALANQRLTAEEKARLENEKKSILIQRQIRAVEKQRDGEVAAAQAQVDAAKQAQANAQARLDLAKSEVEVMQKYIEQQIELNNLLSEQKKLIEDAAKAGEDLAGEDTYKPPEQGTPTDWQSKLKGFLDEAKTKADNLALAFQGFKDKLIAFGSDTGITSAIGNLMTSLNNLGNAIPPLTGEGGLLDKLAKGIDVVRGVLGIPEGESFLDWFTRKISDFKKGVSGAWEGLKNILKPFADALFTFSDLYNKAMRNFAEAETHFASKGGNTHVYPGGGGGEGGGSPIGAAVIGFLNGLKLAFQPYTFFLSAVNWINMFSVSMYLLSSVLERFGDTWEGYKTTWKDFWEIIKSIGHLMTLPADELQAGYDRIGDGIKKLVSDSVQYFKEWKDDFVTTATDIYNALVGHSIFPDMMKEIKSITSGTMQEVSDDWANKLVAMKNVAKTQSDQMVLDIGGNFDKIKLSASTLKTTIADELSKAVQALKDSFSNLGPEVIDPLISKLNELNNTLQNVIISMNNLNTAASSTSSTASGTTVNYSNASQARAFGGNVFKGLPYMVGERTSEVFVPGQNGSIIPSISAFASLLQGVMASPVMAGSSFGAPQTINNYYTVEVNPTYKNVQSEASVWYDATAALAAVRR